MNDRSRSQSTVPKGTYEKKRNYTSFEKDYLAHYYRDNVDVLECKDTKSEANSRKRKKWNELATAFNASFPDCKRSADELKWTIKNMKAAARALPHVRRVNPTSGGPALLPFKSQWEEILVELLRDPSTNRFEGGMESQMTEDEVRDALLKTVGASDEEDQTRRSTGSAIEYVEETGQEEGWDEYAATGTVQVRGDREEQKASASEYAKSGKPTSSMAQNEDLSGTHRKLMELEMLKIRKEIEMMDKKILVMDKKREQLGWKIGNEQIRRELLKAQLNNLGYATNDDD